jgi:hypothetical protein
VLGMNVRSLAWLVPVCMVLVVLAVDWLVYWFTGHTPCTFVAWYWGWCT